MCKIYYNILKANLEDLESLYMDCDSFFISFKTKDINNDLSELEDYFDFSNPDGNSSQM